MQSVKSNELWSPLSLAKALTAADNAIAQEVAQNSSLDGMGTTLPGVTCTEDKLDWISVGDSLLLLFRDSKLEQLNDDHSMLPVLMESAKSKGQNRAVALKDPRRHRLRSALIGRTPKLVDTGMLELRPKDIVLIASDGLETLDISEIRGVLTENRDRDPVSLVTIIITKILEKEALQQDNATLIVCRHG